MAGYLGSTPVPQATQHRESFTATSGQTTFATAGYTAGFVDVYLNGSHLSPADFTATNGSDVVLASGASADDVCDIISHSAFEVADQTFTGTTTMDVAAITGVLTTTAATVFDGGFVSNANSGIGLAASSGVRLEVKTTSADHLVARFENSHASGSFGISVKAGDDSGNYSADFANKSGTSLMRIKGDGIVLVGKTANNFQSVGVEAKANGSIFGTADSNNPLILVRKSDDGLVAQFYRDSTNKGGIGVVGANIFISAASGVGLGIGGDNLFPTNAAGASTDDALDIGDSSARFDDIHATNGTIQTSDRNEKQDIASLTSAEMLVAKRISALFKTFRWKNKVAAKGDNARTHTGIIAQDVQAAFTAESLDSGDYSLFISSTWWEHDVDVAAVEADDTVTPPIKAVDAYTRTDNYDTEDAAPSGSTSRTRLGIRYSELLSFVAAYNEQRFAAIETRLTALEG